MFLGWCADLFRLLELYVRLPVFFSASLSRSSYPAYFVLASGVWGPVCGLHSWRFGTLWLLCLHLCGADDLLCSKCSFLDIIQIAWCAFGAVNSWHCWLLSRLGNKVSKYDVCNV